jgi:hypothetical protein
LFTVIIFSLGFLLLYAENFKDQTLFKEIPNNIKNLLKFSLTWYFFSMIPILFMPERHHAYYLTTALFGFSIFIGVFIYLIYYHLYKKSKIFGNLYFIGVVISIALISHYLAKEIYMESEIFEASQIIKMCVEKLNQYKIDNGDVLYFLGDSKKIYWASDRGIAFEIILKKQITCLFEFSINNNEKYINKSDFIIKYNNFNCEAIKIKN